MGRENLFPRLHDFLFFKKLRVSLSHMSLSAEELKHFYKWDDCERGLFSDVLSLKH